MDKTPIYTVGAGRRVQYACRSDGVWFVRNNLDLTAGSIKWGAWIPRDTPGRPPLSWYNPKAGSAKLPKE